MKKEVDNSITRSGIVWGVTCIIAGVGIIAWLVVSVVASGTGNNRTTLSSGPSAIDGEAQFVRRNIAGILGGNAEQGLALTEPKRISISDFPACTEHKAERHNGPFLQFIDPNTAFTDERTPPLVEIRDLVSTKGGRSVCLEETTAYYLREMVQAAKEEGLNIVATSGYRSHNLQNFLYERAEERGANDPLPQVAEPGHSEHHLGTTVDVTGAGAGFVAADASFANSSEYAWMREHAHEYGFIQSYPDGASARTGYSAEAWHWRWIGVENAKIIRDESALLNELLELAE